MSIMGRQYGRYLLMLLLIKTDDHSMSATLHVPQVHINFLSHLSSFIQVCCMIRGECEWNSDTFFCIEMLTLYIVGVLFRVVFTTYYRCFYHVSLRFNILPLLTTRPTASPSSRLGCLSSSCHWLISCCFQNLLCQADYCTVKSWKHEQPFGTVMNSTRHLFQAHFSYERTNRWDWERTL